jgi:hypothetical protein
MNGTDTGAHGGQSVFGVPDSIQPFILPHACVGLFFIVLLRWKTIYLPLSIPAVLLAGYHEWALHTKDGTSTVRYSLVGLLISWLATFAYRLVRRRMLMHNLVSFHPPSPSGPLANDINLARSASQPFAGPHTYHGSGNM